MPQLPLIRRTSAQAAAIAVAAMTLLAPAQAQAPQNSACWLLEQELAAYDTVARGGPEVARLNQSIATQQDALRRTDGHARSIGCYKSGFLFFRPKRPPECPKLRNTVRNMQRNLASLTGGRDRMIGPPRRDDPGKRRILSLLANNRCGPQYSRWANVGRSRGLFGLWLEEDSEPLEDYRGGFEGGRARGEANE